MGIVFLPLKSGAQEFPVTTTTNATTLGGVAFDGYNYLFGFVEDSVNNVTAQFVSSSGALVGSKISVGYIGGAPLVAFDGTKYLLLWSSPKQLFNPDKSIIDSVHGQFVSTSGTLIGSRFLVAANATISSPKGGCLEYNNGLYMVIYKQNDINYAVTINPSGTISTPVQLSTQLIGDNAIAFDGTNYLVAWWTHGINHYGYEQDIYGQFISSTGSLVGQNFLIDDDNLASDNPLSIAFDGTNYMVTYHAQVSGGGEWNLYSRFVSTSAVVDNKICLRDSTYSPSFGYSSFDGTNYLVTWADNAFSLQSVIRGRYYNTQGVPIDSMFTIFTSLNGDIPVFAGHFFTNNKFLVVTFRMDTSNFTYGDIYGAFIPSSTSSLTPIRTGEEIYTIYPNPASDKVNIVITNNKIYKSLNIYNILGRRVITQSINQDKTQVDVSGLSTGVYFIQLSDGNNNKTHKLVIKR
ncbi:MAG: Flagellar hook-length control protein FliK [Bacteroidetes bacterium]|nr:Flagellar hook-length control protein FliK [Bacteroidota bacterium]